MPFCASCGTNIADNDRFCARCGSARIPLGSKQQIPQPYSYQTRPVANVTDQPKVITILPHATIMTPVGASDVYTIVFTHNQAIMAKLTGDILRDMAQKSQARGKAEGKGWLGRVGDRMRGSDVEYKRYLEMTPAQILCETPGNFAIDHPSVTSVSVRLIYVPTNQDGPGDPYTEIEFYAAGCMLKYRVRLQLKDVTEILNSFYPGRVKG